MEVNLVEPVPPGNTGVAACMIVPEILKEGNYERWCIFMEHFLVAQDLWDIVSLDQSPIENPRDWVKKNALALHAIKISCEATSFDRIKKMYLAQEAWNALADMHKQPKEDASRGSEADTGENFTNGIEVNWSNTSIDSYIELNKKEAKETCTRILKNNERTKILSSLHDGNLNALKKLDRITEIVFPGGFTVLHVATLLGHLKIVEELMKIKGEDYLEIKDENGDTALSLAACKGIVKIAKCLVMKNDKLLYIPNNKGYVPLVVACINRQKDLASYLYSIIKFEFLVSEKDKQGILFLKYCVLNFMPDVGLDLFLRCPRLAASEESITLSDLALQPSLFYSGAFLSFFPFDMLLYKYLNVVELPTPSDKAVSPRKLEIFKRQVAFVEVLGGRYIIRLGKLRRIYYLKLTHRYANLVLRHWCKEISTYTDATQLVASGAISVIYQAIKNGTLEIVVEILKANPDLVWCNEELTRKMIIMAIKYRRGSLLTFGYKLDAGKKALLSLRDKDGNNALHIVAKLPVYPYDSVGIHAAWAMIREERWFEEIKRYLPCWSHEAKNRYGETPDQVFYREHQELITNMEEWGKKTAKSYSLASVLIVTIMFAALFTVPGGIDEKTGMPKLSHIKELSGFLMCDAVSFITASTSFFGFLSVLTLTYKRSGPRGALPFQMLFAISTLSISIATMILAFIFALLMMLENKWRVLPALIIYLLVVFYFLLSDWQIPTFLSLFVMMVFNPSSYLDSAYGRHVKTV